MMHTLDFDTGLTARAFAQSKFAQFITEPGLIVRPSQTPPHQVALWKASGVREVAGADGKPTMVIWGPPVEGERLNTLLDGHGPQDAMLAAVSLWIQAVLAVGEDASQGERPPVPLWPCAAMIMQEQPAAIFFAPYSLAQRNVTSNDEWYVNPDLGSSASNGGASNGSQAAAFTAAAMLYRVFVGTPPFTAVNSSTLYQDMRDGNYLPPHLAVPGLNARLAALMQAALEQHALEQPSGKALLDEIIGILQTGGRTVSAASLIQPLTEPERLLLEKEKSQFLKIKTATIKTRRFVARNTALLLGALAGAVIAAFIVFSVVQSRALLPTTAGMEPVTVIESYYYAFGELDHQTMEACATGGAGKNDINMVVNLFVMNKTRQAYELNAPSMITPAHAWRQDDGPPDPPLFGATDLRIEWLEGDEDGGALRYRVNYTFWIPEQLSGEETLSPDNTPPGSLSYNRRDYLTLVRKKGNWRIAEITRE